MDYILVREKEGYEEYPISKVLNIGSEVFDVKQMIPFCWQRMKEEKEYLYINGLRHTFERLEMVTIAAEEADICIQEFSFRFVICEGYLYIEKGAANEADVYINERKLDKTEYGINIPYTEGDIILANTVRIVLLNKKIIIQAKEGTITSSLLEVPEQENIFEGFPRYKRSPRLIKKIPSEKIEIDNPPEKTQMSKGSLLQIILTPVIMLCITVGISIVE